MRAQALDQGRLVEPGAYELRMESVDSQGNRTVATGTVTVLRDKEAVSLDLRMAPNPALRSDAGVLVAVQVPVLWRLQGQVYNSAGELVGSLSQGPAGLYWGFERLHPAAGVYMVAVTGIGPDGQVKRAAGKLALR